MSARIRITIGLSVIGALVLAIGPALTQGRLVLSPAETLKWTDNPGVPGAKVSVLWGDPSKGAYGALKQVPGGTVLAAHTHKLDSRVVVVKGSIALGVEGKTTVLSPGSYAMIPGGLPHAATCRGAAPCEYLEEMQGPFDSTPVKK